MEKSDKIGSEITVRISLAFQDAPDVHTLLAMTPVRERGKLVRLALERYIAATGHPAGNVDAQIEAISQWLKNRAPTHVSKLGSRDDLSATETRPGNKNQKDPIEPALPPDTASRRPIAEQVMDRPGSMTTTTNEFESPSVRRWLMS